jgi:hypothetical protein
VNRTPKPRPIRRLTIDPPIDISRLGRGKLTG